MDKAQAKALSTAAHEVAGSTLQSGRLCGAIARGN